MYTRKIKRLPWNGTGWLGEGGGGGGVHSLVRDVFRGWQAGHARTGMGLPSLIASGPGGPCPYTVL